MISVIIPVYNVEKYVVDCLSSIENQTFKELEIIIVNDGSTDKSLERINDYLKTSSLNAKVITQQNAGVSVARNVGIAHASGQYVSFIDSDDILHPRYFDEQLKSIISFNADMAICGRKELQEDAGEYNDALDQIETVVYGQTEALERLLYGKIKVGIWSVLCKRALLGDIRFAEGVAYGEDLEVLWKLVSKSQRIVSNSALLYGYRIRASSAMGKMSPKRVAGMTLFVDLEQYFEEKNPRFATLYKQYGVARWVWATMWQAAVASRSYSLFKEITMPYSPSRLLRKLLTYPDVRVKLSSLVYVISPFAYYAVVRIIRNKLRSVT